MSVPSAIARGENLQFGSPVQKWRLASGLSRTPSRRAKAAGKISSQMQGVLLHTSTLYAVIV
jgi:hypothetical protein